MKTSKIIVLTNDELIGPDGSFCRSYFMRVLRRRRPGEDRKKDGRAYTHTGDGSMFDISKEIG